MFRDSAIEIEATMDSQDVNILTLPEDVIIVIFQFLPQFEVLQNIRLTCKIWNHYSRDGILWRRIRDLDFIRETFRIENFMGFLGDISHLVEELEVHMNFENLQKKQFFFPRLKSLKLDDYDVSKNDLENSLKEIKLNYPMLEVLHVTIAIDEFDMTCCPMDLKELIVTSWTIEETIKPIRNIGEHFKALIHLGLRGSTLNNQTVLALLSMLPCLESIDLTDTSYTIDLIDDEEIPDKPCSKRIQKVVLTNTHPMFFPRVFMYILSSAHERIRYIDISYPSIDISNQSQKSHTSPCLNNIAEKCRQLDTLILGNYKEYDPDQDINGINTGIKDVVSNNKHLSTIKMNFVESIIDDDTVMHVFQNCSNLQWIELSGCESLSDNTLRNIVNGERLHTMKVSKCTFAGPWGIGMAFERCNRLRTLLVEGIETIELILERKSCQLMNYLMTLSLANCVELSDECLDQIAKCCPILRSINLTCCSRITDVGFIQFVHQCASITEIILKDSAEHRIDLTGHAFAAVASCENNLERLTLGCFSKITFEAIHELISKCPKLTAIVFCDTYRLWIFDVVITASKLDMTVFETQKFTDKLRRELRKLQPQKGDIYPFYFKSTIRLHRDCSSRRNKEKLYSKFLD